MENEPLLDMVEDSLPSPTGNHVDQVKELLRQRHQLRLRILQLQKQCRRHRRKKKHIHRKGRSHQDETLVLKERVEALETENVDLRRQTSQNVKDRVTDMKETLSALEQTIDLEDGSQQSTTSKISSRDFFDQEDVDCEISRRPVPKTSSSNVFEPDVRYLLRSAEEMKMKLHTLKEENRKLRRQIDDLLSISRRKDSDILNLLEKFLRMKKGKEKLEHELICRDFMHTHNFQKIIEQLNEANSDINYLAEQLRGKGNSVQMKFIIKLIQRKIALQDENSVRIKKRIEEVKKRTGRPQDVLKKCNSESNLVTVKDAWEESSAILSSSSSLITLDQRYSSSNSWTPSSSPIPTCFPIQCQSSPRPTSPAVLKLPATEEASTKLPQNEVAPVKMADDRLVASGGPKRQQERQRLSRLEKPRKNSDSKRSSSDGDKTCVCSKSKTGCFTWSRSLLRINK